MKVLLKTSSLLLALILACACFAGCHVKNETAITIGEIKIKSSTYSCALTQAYQEGISKVEEEESAKESSEHNHNDGYMKEKIGKKSFGDWVKNRADEICKEYAAVYTLAKTNKISLSDDELSQISQTAEYYWTNYGLEELYGSLGVSKDTYEGFMGYTSLKEKVFTTLYGENGSKAVDKAEVTSTLYSQHNTAEILKKTFSDGESADDVKAQYQGYVDRLNAGESFKSIYCEVNNTTEEELDEQMASYAASDSEQPANSLEQVVGSVGTDYENDLFDTVKNLEVGQATLYSDDSYCAVIVKTDITKDDYYKDNLYNSALRYLKGDEYDKLIEDTYKALDFKESKYATRRFKVKDVNEQYMKIQEENSSQQSSTNQ